MSDFIFIGLTVLFFTITIGLINICELLMECKS
jgi:hypothetical protein